MFCSFTLQHLILLQIKPTEISSFSLAILNKLDRSRPIPVSTNLLRFHDDMKPRLELEFHYNLELLSTTSDRVTRGEWILLFHKLLKLNSTKPLTPSDFCMFNNPLKESLLPSSLCSLPTRRFRYWTGWKQRFLSAWPSSTWLSGRAGSRSRNIRPVGCWWQHFRCRWSHRRHELRD